MTRRTHAPPGAHRITIPLLALALLAPARALAQTPASPPPTIENLPSARWPNPPAAADVPTYWKTRAEKSDYRLTADYEETMRYCRLLEAASRWVKVVSYGRSEQGRDLPLVIVSRDGAFTPDQALASGRPIILIQNGIHAGEIEGKDATLALLRDMIVLHRHEDLLDNVILLILPIFSVDAHERKSPWNRINQNGPDEMGWRFTPMGLNLNRDYLKVETPEIRALIGKVYTQWWPHLLIDDHTTDGADFRHDLTLSWNHGAGTPPAVDRWLADAMGRVVPRTQALGHLTAPYLSFRRGNDPLSGVEAGSYPPRFSTGYTPLQCRPSILVETHMLKPYASRVRATYDLLLAVLEEVHARPQALTAAVAAAEAEAVARGRRSDPAQREIVLTTRVGARADSFAFKGWQTRWEKSDVSGAPVARYTPAPWDTTIAIYRDIEPVITVRAPAGYVLPQEWSAAIDRLDVHGVRYRRFAAPWRDTVEVQHVLEWSAAQRSFEGHRPITVTKVALERRLREARPGDLWVPLDQRSGAVAVHLLEAQAPDGLMYWNVFDTVFEQKEYAEDYVMEPIARRMLHDDPALARAFQARLAADSAFAKNPGARMDFFYRRSPWADSAQDAHPALRALRPPPESVLGR
ncbi:MAG: peptidase M14 [Candidatus Eisenbacteria bacterium]|nr:peptidase M14 [Candidatus Eisenbacteria bacterium]